MKPYIRIRSILICRWQLVGIIIVLNETLIRRYANTPYQDFIQNNNNTYISGITCSLFVHFCGPFGLALGMGMEAAGGRGDGDIEEGRQLQQQQLMTWKTAAAYFIGNIFSIKNIHRMLISRCFFSGFFVAALVVDVYGFEAGVGGLLAGESLSRNALMKLGGRVQR